MKECIRKTNEEIMTQLKSPEFNEWVKSILVFIIGIISFVTPIWMVMSVGWQLGLQAWFVLPALIAGSICTAYVVTLMGNCGWAK